MVDVDQIEDFELLKKHARLMVLELDYFQKRVKEMAQELAQLKGGEQLEFLVVKQAEQLARLRHKVFGESSERRPSPVPPAAEAEKPKRGHGPTAQAKLPSREVHHRLKDDERACPVCKGTLEEMSGQTEDSEEIDVEPRRFTVLKHRRHKYRCRCNGAIKTAPGPLRLIVGGRYSLDFAIALEIDKRLNHLPLDRQRRQMEREGLVISIQAMWDQEDALADLMEPSYLKLLESSGTDQFRRPSMKAVARDVTEEQTTTSVVVSATDAATVRPTTATVKIVTTCQPLRPLEGGSTAPTGSTSLTTCTAAPSNLLGQVAAGLTIAVWEGSLSFSAEDIPGGWMAPPQATRPPAPDDFSETRPNSMIRTRPDDTNRRRGCSRSPSYGVKS